MAYSNFYARLHAWGQKTGAAFGAVWRFYPTRFYLPIFVFWQILAWVQAWLIFHNLTGDLLVLHYNVDFGIDLVSDPSRIFLYPIFGLVACFVVLILAAIFNRQADSKLINHLLFAGAALFGLLLSLVLLSIFLINFV